MQPLSPEGRAHAIEQLARDELDVLVIGGGITGAGAALDAVTRGLRVGIIESRDWASGTSSRSSKLVHGGIRYLEQLNFKLVHEALTERGRLMNVLAPHLVQPIRLLYPLATRLSERLYVGAGMLLYDLFARAGGVKPWLPFHRHFSARQLRRIAPGLKRGSFTGGLGYYDGQVDDARLVITVVKTAVEHGALAANRVRAEGFVRDSGRITGVTATDLESGESITIHAREVINATGVWTDDILEYAGAGMKPTVRMSKGVHLTVDRDAFRSRAGLLLRTPTSVLFVLPWGEHWIIGTTDTDWHDDKAHPTVTDADIEQILGTVNQVLATPLSASDIRGAYAGLRPLITGESENTSQLSREHAVFTVEPGLTSIVGGKLTTYRVMAEDIVNHVAEPLGVGPSVTATLPLTGAQGFAKLWSKRSRLAERSGLSTPAIERLLRRYGDRTGAVLDLIEQAPDLANEISGADQVIGAEVIYAIRHEGALHLDDVLVRRTHLSIETGDFAKDVASHVARLMAEELGWNAERVGAEIDRYLESVSQALAGSLLS